MCSASDEEVGGSAALNCGERWTLTTEYNSKHALFANEHVLFFKLKPKVGCPGVPGCSRGHGACSGSKP